MEYLIVGGEAVIFYGHARYTGDVDFFYADTDKNVSALFEALSVFLERGYSRDNPAQRVASPESNHPVWPAAAQDRPVESN
ncbi:MAG: hypothetical protein H8E20_12305 [Verrucomicrobia bacterium]|nr:hypothetical protein [Verrucomicrobiota bacterium]